MRSLKLLLFLLLAAPASAFAQGKLNVVTTTEDSGAIAREIGGDKVTVTTLAKGYRIRTSSIRSPASSWR